MQGVPGAECAVHQCVVLQLQLEAEHTERDNKISDLFEYWDHDASGVIDLAFIECALSLYKPTPLADAIAEGNDVVNCHVIKMCSSFS